MVVSVVAPVVVSAAPVVPDVVPVVVPVVVLSLSGAVVSGSPFFFSTLIVISFVLVSPDLYVVANATFISHAPLIPGIFAVLVYCHILYPKSRSGTSSPSSYNLLLGLL